MSIGFPVLPARPHALRLVDDLGDGFPGLVLADKGFIAACRYARLAQRHGVGVVTPPRKGRTTPHSPSLLKLWARLRQGVGRRGGEVLSIRVRAARGIPLLA